MIKGLIYIILTSVLVNNYVLTKFLGICPFLGVSKKVGQAAGMGVAVTFVMILATAVTHLQTIVFILVIASLVQLVEIILKKYIPSLHKALGIYLPLITTNCAVLGVCANNITDGYNFLEAMASSLGCGLGFLLAMLLFAGVRQKVENANPPKCFRGVPITLVSAAIVALCFNGFAGIVETLFA